jgi:hypothetical protein
MSHDAVIVRRGVRKEGISGDVLIPAVDIGSRPAGTAVFAKGIARCIARKLSGVLDRLFNTLKGQPAEIRTECLEIGCSIGDASLVDASFEDGKGSVSGKTHGLFGTAFMCDEVDVGVKIAGALAQVIDTEILVTGVRRCIKDKVSDREFIIETARIPNVITGEEDVRKGVPLKVIRGAYAHVREARPTAEGNVAAVRGDETLETTVVARCVMDQGTKSTELRRRMDSVPLATVSMLVKENNRSRAAMSSDKTGHSGWPRINSE